MTPEALAARLVEAGLDPGELERKRDLFRSVAAEFARLCSNTPDCGYWVPGRLEVFGKHTDYCGGHSLVGTIPRGFALLARRRPDSLVRLRDARRGEALDLAAGAVAGGAAEANHAVAGWRRYAHVAVARLGRNFPGAPIGADIVFASDLPSASGMSSSSALVVGLVNALVDIAGLRDRAEWRENLRGREDVAGYYACFENGFSFGSLVGDGGVGTHGGSEDHVAIVCGRANGLSAWRFVPIRHVADVTVPETWTFVIVSSGVAAQKIGAAKERYNSLSRRASALLAIWNRSQPPQPSLFAALSSSPSAVDRLRELLPADGDPVDRLEPRLDQFVREDRRVLEAIAAFRDGDRVRLGDLSLASQQDADSLLGNQVPETADLAREARQLGAFAAASFGAGFGGSVWALVDHDEAPQFAERWLAGYRARFPARAAAASFVARPGPSLTRLF